MFIVHENNIICTGVVWLGKSGSDVRPFIISGLDHSTDYWTGSLDWITGLDHWTGLLDRLNFAVLTFPQVYFISFNQWLSGLIFCNDTRIYIAIVFMYVYQLRSYFIHRPFIYVHMRVVCLLYEGLLASTRIVCVWFQCLKIQM